MTDTVTLDAQTAARLAAHALNQLWDADQDDEDPEVSGCCPECCGPCVALRQLLDAGQLDDVVRPYVEATGGDWSWWVNNQVDRDWLTRAWRMTLCHAGADADVAGTVDTGSATTEPPETPI